MDLTDLFSLQGTLFLLMLVGALLKRIGLISEEGKRCLSNLIIYVILPCTIFKSCFVSMPADFLRIGALLLLSGSLMEVLSLVLNQFLYRSYGKDQAKVMKYGTLVPNSGFLGTPIAEGIYHSQGVLYSAIFLIPVRIFMWSFGNSYFLASAGTSRKKLFIKVITHPCLVAVFLSLVVMILHIPIPEVLRRGVQAIASCNSALAMFVVGTILADVNLLTIVNRHSLYLCFVRLVLLPGLTLLLGRFLGLGGAALGVSVLMIGMPAGATTSIFPALYGGDAVLGTQCVVLSTLLSMLTLPLWIAVL
jgi:predicted permease